MMKNAGLILFLGVSFVAQNSFAQSFSQSRFTTLTQGTKTALEDTVVANPGIFTMTAVQMGDILDKSGDRNNAFQIEGLSLIYSNYPSADAQSLIVDINTTSKQLEDLIGNYDKYAVNDLEPQAQETAVLLADGVFGADGNEASCFITQAGASPKFDPLLTRINQVQWLSESDDRTFVLNQMANMLTTIAAADYDMGRLEAGLHELRRVLRWFPISAVALGGLIQTSDQGDYACKQTVNFNDSAGRFPTPTTQIDQKVCTVTKCLYDDIDGVVAILGQLKDGVEKTVIQDGDDITPADTAAKATVIYGKLKDSKVLENLAAEIKNCI
jgi:hypothetical protein